GQPIAVHIVNSHIASACRSAPPASKGNRVKLPGCTVRAGGGLLPPSLGVQNIDAAVLIDVSRADAVRRPRAALGDVMDDPLRGYILRIRPGKADVAIAGGVNQLRLTVAVDIANDRLLTEDRINHMVVLPAALLSGRIDVQISPNATPGSEYIGPAITVEVCCTF